MGHCWKPQTAPTGGDPNHIRKSPLPVGRCYLPNDNGKQAKLRRLRQQTRKLQPSIEQNFRLNVWLKTALAEGQHDREHARMVVLNTARLYAEETLVTFGEALGVVLDRLEREQSNEIRGGA